jgi:hypothetical protein
MLFCRVSPKAPPVFIDMQGISAYHGGYAIP